MPEIWIIVCLNGNACTSEGERSPYPPVVFHSSPSCSHFFPLSWIFCLALSLELEQHQNTLEGRTEVPTIICYELPPPSASSLPFWVFVFFFPMKKITFNSCKNGTALLRNCNRGKLKDKLSTGEKERKADSKQKTGRMKELDKEEEEKG